MTGSYRYRMNLRVAGNTVRCHMHGPFLSVSEECERDAINVLTFTKKYYKKYTP